MGFSGSSSYIDISCTSRKSGYYIGTAVFLLMSVNVSTNNRIKNKYVIPATAELLFCIQLILGVMITYLFHINYIYMFLFVLLFISQKV